MYKVNINGQDYLSEKDMALMDFLRDVVGITSVKNGCHEGACGACTVIIDGKTYRSCTQKLSRLEGKKVQTIEGFTQRERDVFSYAFAAVGAVQCGFCIPGMVVCGKNLTDNNPDPTVNDVRLAIRNNICRCTGYAKIVEAILLAAKMLREDLPVPEVKQTGRIGERTMRIDAKIKALGQAKYADDFHFDGMLYGKNVFSKYARAKVLSIDVTPALKLPGVVAVFTAKDIPGRRYIGHLSQDWPGLIDAGEETKFIGDSVAIVVAESLEQAVAGVQAVAVEYEELTPVRNPEEAMALDAPQIHGEGYEHFGKFIIPKNNLYDHKEVIRGDADAKIASSKYVAEGTFILPPTEHAFMEPETSVALPDGEDGVLVITGTQGIYDDHREIANYLGIPREKVRIQSAYVGGGFGGKEDMSVQHQAALCAFLLKRPVKVSFSRQESINYHPKRHAMTIHCKIGCDENGILRGIKAHIISDTGAYASLGGPVLQRACTHLGGPYNYHDVSIVGDAYYTNNPPAGAFRGFGVTQSCATVEPLINQLAEMAGISGWEIRYRNAIRPGQSLPNGQVADQKTAFAETLEAVKPYFDQYEADPDYYVGIASAMKNTGVGVGVPDPGRCNLAIIDGKVHARSSAGAIGQGVQTVMMQIICETTGLLPDRIVIEHPDTKFTPDSSTTTASRQTVFCGEATRRAALQLKQDLDSGNKLEELEGKLYQGEFDYKTDPIGCDKPNPISHITYGYATQLFIIDREGKVVRVIAAHDSGKIINPMSAEGQVEGGIAMALGYALTEDFPLKDGVPQVKLGTLGIFKANMMPPIQTIFVERIDGDQPAYGAKGIGEITTTMGAPALQNAYYKKDGVFRYRLPLENTFYRKPKTAETTK